MKSYDILNFRSIYFHIADKIFEQTTCENKSLRELPFFNLQFLFVSSPVSKKYQRMSICTMTLKSVGKIYPRRWYMNGNFYSARSIHLGQLFRFKLFKLYSIFWNVLIWLKYDLMHIFIHHRSLYLTYNVSHNYADTWRWIRGPLWIFEGNIDFDPEDECLTLTSGYYLTGQEKSIATKYVINVHEASLIFQE